MNTHKALLNIAKAYVKLAKICGKSVPNAEMVIALAEGGSSANETAEGNEGK